MMKAGFGKISTTKMGLMKWEIKFGTAETVLRSEKDRHDIVASRDNVNMVRRYE